MPIPPWMLEQAEDEQVAPTQLPKVEEASGA
jgi:hypothetical protein